MYKVLKPSEETFKLAGEAIKQGKVIVVPTDAVYAVVCDAFNEDAVARLRTIRQSPAQKPLSIIMDKDVIEEYAILEDNTHKMIIDELLPGKVSFLLKKKGKVFEEAIPNNDSMCVFWQNNETKEVYKNSGTILAISSANKASCPEAITVEEAIAYFGGEVELYIDSGEERGNKGTTQLDLRESEIKVMRESGIFPIQRIVSILEENNIDVKIAR